MNRISQRLIIVGSSLLLLACSSINPRATGPQPRLPEKTGQTHPAQAERNPPPANRGGYYQDDGPGDLPVAELLRTPDAEPRIEPIAKATTRSYTVLGRSYTPITDERPFVQRGIGSWYGKKFHGQRTASGERYDMYKMTAAHPTLPIPSYARVTNLDSGTSVIVRINDRGPFHATRIVDVSYTAALKLGLTGKGSRQVEVSRLLPDDIARINQNKASTLAQARSTTEPAPAMPDQPGNIYLQLGAYSQSTNAEQMRQKLGASWQSPWPGLQVMQVGSVYRLLSGPFDSRERASDVAQQMQNDGLPKPLVVQR
jgi:rare lipoprotein A